MGKFTKKIPSTENGPGVCCTTKGGQVYHITQCLGKRQFSLWHEVDSGYERLGSAKSPIDLNGKIPWDQ